jgi:hypothetical protein
MFIEHAVRSNGCTLSCQAEDKMQKKELSLATFKVADRVISGRATAEESNRDLQTEKESQRPRIVSLSVSWCFMAAGLFVASALMPARADAQALAADVAALKAQVAALQSQVNTLQTELAKVQSNKALGLDPFVSVVSGLVDGVNGPHIYFTGANIHIVSGSTTTADVVTGLGNLIIGYDEVPNLSGGDPLQSFPNDRGGSHNLIIGAGHRFRSDVFGGLLAGENNTLFAAASSIVGGNFNTTGDRWASVLGGSHNSASGQWATVSGGGTNTASGAFAAILGGLTNRAQGPAASVCGGENNAAFEAFSAVLGGFSNAATGNSTVVLGGSNVIDNKGESIAPQPPFP